MSFATTIARKLFQLSGLHVERGLPHQQVLAFVQSLRALTPQMPLLRVGAKNDGGYLIPDDLAGIDYVFSPGVGKKCLFELELVERGLSAFLCDRSVAQPPTSHPRIHFLPKFLGLTNDNEYVTLKTWLEDCIGNQASDLLLQMDIEGSEYQVLLSTPIESLCRFRIIVVEFHFLEFMGSRLSHDLISSTFRHLMNHFSIVHLHPNNCCKPINVSGVSVHPVVEVTFLRNDRIISTSKDSQRRHHLDRDCVPGHPSVELAREWHWN